MKNNISVKNIFKSLFSNQSAIDCRKNPWWVAFIIFILAVFLPWIPSLSTAYLANTAAIFTAEKNQEIDKGFKSVILSNYFKKVTIQKDSEGKYVLEYNFTDEDYSTNPNDFDNEYKGTNTKDLYKGTFHDSLGTDSKSYATNYSTNFSKGNLSNDYYYDNISVDTTNVIDPVKTSSSSSSSSTVVYETGRVTYLENYYLPGFSIKTQDYSIFLNNFVSSVILGVQKTGNVSEATRYPHSYAIWAQDFVLVAVYPLRSAKTSLSVSGSFSGNINDGFSVANESVVAGTSFYKYLTNDGQTQITQAYNKAFCDFMHRAGRPAHLRQAWINVGILSAMVAGAVLVSSLLVFLFLKRKTSIYRDSNYFNALNISTYMALTPSIIAMVLTFFNPSFTMMALIGANLIRAVFVMNKICPPQNQDSGRSKPLYQARS